MAKYDGLTDKQLAVLEPMTKEATTWKRKYDEVNERLAKKIIAADFEENQRLRKMARDFKRKYEDAQAEINSIVNAREEYEYCVSKAQSLCKRAESLKETWDFE